MIPLKDDIPARRFPLITVMLIAAAVVAVVLGADVWPLVLSSGFLWLFGPSVEDSMGRLRFILFAALGAAAAAAIDPEAAGGGLVAAVLGGYALLYPRAHVVALRLVPGFMTVVQLPALAVLALWPALYLLTAGADPAPLAGLAAGLVSVRLLAHDAQRDYQRAPAY